MECLCSTKCRTKSLGSESRLASTSSEDRASGICLPCPLSKVGSVPLRKPLADGSCSDRVLVILELAYTFRGNFLGAERCSRTGEWGYQRIIIELKRKGSPDKLSGESYVHFGDLFCDQRRRLVMEEIPSIICGTSGPGHFPVTRGKPADQKLRFRSVASADLWASAKPTKAVSTRDHRW